jgi:membrane-bound lytic murein transglycosylase A
MKSQKAFLVIILLILIITSISCGRKIVTVPTAPPVVWTPENALMQMTVMPDLSDDESPDSLLNAIDQSLQKFREMDRTAFMRFGGTAVAIEKIIAGLEDFRAKLAEIGLGDEFYRYVRENYIFYSSAAPQVLFTGYYEPQLRGSLCPSEIYRYPVYGKPADLCTIDLQQYYFYKQHPDLPPRIRGRLAANGRIVPYYSRSEIDFQNKLADQGLELVWVDSLIDVFFMQVQGSGQVLLDNGESLRVGYADQNGHPYRSIGKFMVETGALSPQQVSMQNLRAYLETHPDEIPLIFNYNPSYIFFNINEQGPAGSFGAALTPWRSIATDPRLLPPGTLAYIECEKPLLDEQNCIAGWKKFGRFVLNQDSGGAIRGPDRVDLFTGAGDVAAIVAGGMKQKGRLFFLLKK